MPSPRKKRKEPDDDVVCVSINEDEDESDNDYDDDEKGEPPSPSCTAATNAAASAANSAKLKCLKCFRAARKDCTGNLCIRCCTDENCVVHQEQRARARWKEAVTEGTTEIQAKAKHKRSRAIPKGRFREEAFRYMNDTVILWDLRTVLEPSIPQKHQQQLKSSGVLASSSRQAAASGTTATTTSSNTTNPTPPTSISSAVMAQYQSDLKVRDEILRRSRKNNQSSSEVKTKLRRNYRGTRKRFRSVMQTLYQKSLD